MLLSELPIWMVTMAGLVAGYLLGEIIERLFNTSDKSLDYVPLALSVFVAGFLVLGAILTPEVVYIR